MSRSLILALAAGTALAVAALASGGAAAKQPTGVTPSKVLGMKLPPMGVTPTPKGITPPSKVLGLKLPPITGVPVKPKPPVTGIPIPGVPVKPPKPPMPFPGIIVNPDPDPDHDHDHDWWWWRHHHGFPVVIEEGAPVVVTGPAAAVSGPAPVSRPCTCLTKTYLDDGSVQFADVCTKETAIATPDQLRAQAQ